MTPNDLAEKFRLIQTYVAWTESDAQHATTLAPLLAPHFETLIHDFYQAIQRDPSTRRLLGDDPHRAARLKQALAGWLRDLLSGPYDDAYIQRRWHVGRTHVEIGLPSFYAIAALSRLRSAMIAIVQKEPSLDPHSRDDAVRALDRLLDLDLAIIDDAYQTALTRKLQRHERLATLGQIAGGIGHELRNPLNVIATSCDYLKRARHLSPEKRDEHLDRIERQVAIGENVIKALSHFAHMPEPASRPLAMGTLIDEALEVDPPPAGITVRRESVDPPPRVLADRDQLRIAIGNVLRNAYEAIDGPGLLVLAVDREGGHARLRITDSGSGIPPDVIPRLTDPLYSSKPRGLGLGLAITRTILERHLGKLELSSPPGQGATVTMTLPAVIDDHPTARAENVRTPEHPPGGP